MRSSCFVLACLMLATLWIASEASGLKDFRLSLTRKIPSITSRAQMTETSDTCASITCAASGQSCVGYVYCTGNAFCSSMGTCVNYTLNGGSCQNPDQCFSGYCNGSKVCTEFPLIEYLNPGHPCTATDLCLFANSTTQLQLCTNGLCYGLANGSPCEYDSADTATSSHEFSQCSDGFCHPFTQTCTSYLAVGENCEVGACNPWLDCACNSSDCSSLLCMIPQTGKLGQYCTDTYFCGDNLYCDAKTSVCVVAKPSYAVCEPSDSLTVCSENEECYCDHNTQSGLCYFKDDINLPGSSSVNTNLVSCVLSSGCNFADDACLAQKCQSQFCAYANLQLASERNQTAMFYPSCFTNDQININSNALATDVLYTKCFSLKDGQEVPNKAAPIVVASSVTLLSLGLAFLL